MRDIVVLTGATGMLGPHLVKALLARSHRVAALARDPAAAAARLPASVRIVACDLASPLPAALDPLLSEARCLVHAAGGFQASLHGADPAEVERLHRGAAVELYDRAAAAGVPRFVALGSAATLGRGADGGAGDEEAPPSALVEKLPYLRAKRAQREALRAREAAGGGPALVEVMPGSLWGPGCPPGSAPWKLTTELLAGGIPGVLRGGAMVVDVRDVAAAIAALVEHPAPERAYALAGRRVELDALYAGLAAAGGVAAPRKRIPDLVATLLSWLAPGRIPPQSLAMMRAGTLVSSERAARDLGFAPRPLAETWADTVAAVRGAGEVWAEG